MFLLWWSTCPEWTQRKHWTVCSQTSAANTGRLTKLWHILFIIVQWKSNRSHSLILPLFVKAALQCEHAHICVHTAERMWSCSPDNLWMWSGWLDLICVLNASWGCSHLYLMLSIYDSITQDRWLYQVWSASKMLEWNEVNTSITGLTTVSNLLLLWPMIRQNIQQQSFSWLTFLQCIASCVCVCSRTCWKRIQQHISGLYVNVLTFLLSPSLD